MGSQIDYADLEFRILKLENGRYPVEITVSTPAGQQEFPGGFLDAQGGPGLADASFAGKEYGLELFAWLFADPTLQKHWAAIAVEHKRRRIRFRIAEEAAELHQYPWEALAFQEGALAIRLSAADATPFSRYLAGRWQPGKPVISRPLRVLVAIANPTDLAAQRPPLDPIDPQAELQALAQSLQPLGAAAVTLTQLQGPCTLKALAAELRKGYHVLHLICHGATASAAATSSVLFLADEHNRTARVTDLELAEQLALQLADSGQESEHKLRLVFLASCETAKRSSFDAFRGVAPRLVAAGVPAVLAMQDLVGMEAARAFAASFYARLLEHGRVDLAANQAREALLAATDEATQQQLAVPALFLRLKDGQLLGVPGTVSGQPANLFWPFLLRRIERGECTVFLGPRINTGGIADSADIARKLAKQYAYPLRDTENRLRIAQFIALQGQDILRDDYLLLAKESVLRSLGEAAVGARQLKKRSLAELLEAYRWSERATSIQEDEPHLLLADLPIGLYMTTNPDCLMYAALLAQYRRLKAAAANETDPNRRAELEALQPPRREQPQWEQASPGSPEFALTPDPAPEQPVVFHLNGYDADPAHLVLSEDDYMHHLIHLMDEKLPRLPANVKGRLAKNSLVFIGFALDDWEFRLILHGLLKRIDLSQGMRHVGVQLEVGPATDEGQARRYLEAYMGSHRIDIYWGTPRQFVNELHSRWKLSQEPENGN